MAAPVVWITVLCVRDRQCGKKNWIEIGDLVDQSKMDYESFRCWDCRELQWIDPAVDPPDRDEESLEEAYCVEGLEAPSGCKSI